MIQILEKELNKIQKMNEEIDRELEKLDKIEKVQKSNQERLISSETKNYLRCVTNKGCYQYYINGKYVRKGDIKTAQNIAQRDYCNRIKLVAGDMQTKLYELKKIYEEKQLEREYEMMLPARKRLVTPIVKPIQDVIKEFEELECSGKGFEEDDVTEYYTIKGERVRSKSEKIIADELYRHNVPYKYEMPLELSVRNNKIIIYPDFTVLNKNTGKKWIIEHFGMMDVPSYYENTMLKINTYEKNNYLIGKNLIIFHESLNYPLSTRTIEGYIEAYLL